MYRKTGGNQAGANQQGVNIATRQRQSDQSGAPGELRHHCALDEDALYLIGVWESEELLRVRWASPEFEATLTSVGFPSPKTAELTILRLHAVEPPL